MKAFGKHGHLRLTNWAGCLHPEMETEGEGWQLGPGGREGDGVN